jgi:hypothetical protein
MRRPSAVLVSAVILSLSAGCGGSSPPAEEPVQVAIVELPAPPKASANAEKTPPPAPEETEEPEEEGEEAKAEGEANEQDEARAAGILGVLKGGSSGTLGGPVGILAPMGQGGVSGLGGFGSGSGSGTGQGYGGLGTRGSGAPQPTMSAMSAGASNVTGKLPPEVIRRVVHQHLVRIRYCYEKALTSNPALAGKIAARFVIASDGSVASASDGGSTMPDKSVTECALKVFKSMTFPKPADGATVIVTYPIVFAPSATPPPAPAAPRPGPPPPPAPPSP